MYTEVDTTISFLVKSLPTIYNNFYLEYIKQFIQDKDINKTQIRAITFIYNYGSISMTNLCSMLNIEKGSLTSMIDDLSDKGYLVRIRDKKDRRKFNIALTRKGELLSEDFIELLKESLEERIRKIDIDDLDSFIDSLKNIMGVMEKFEKDEQ
ncbi:MarR family winged helix-turn-helix transcriptional regulator [Peptostreptococcus porci]|uniref:MarR family transcriptional regulator n=1 Tax=Peptostreptococcus porci TaxID=2652282 RepID=A0A6N7XEZ8_9FIRM|nr:MarR family transcriptional regulator [Peptostreptococcus porci]MDD7183132.1 MarR family transcriptional regulator [Peptostreptococcus porci]MDY2793899.1 MarR family transcriptional regulator [Peptostreptococcus porci]MDY4129608.1 MarR family transcriptional regulator [Peptostreptococcus porci]MDY5436816.1 MarR family transcriptional regulator [Peptostreptococcus porci]MDY5479543.1 MarR family transcriptional regulator [Peptostreptococcus porci]